MACTRRPGCCRHCGISWDRSSWNATLRIFFRLGCGDKDDGNVSNSPAADLRRCCYIPKVSHGVPVVCTATKLLTYFLIGLAVHFFMESISLMTQLGRMPEIGNQRRTIVMENGLL